MYDNSLNDEFADALGPALDADASSHNARAALGWVHFTYHRNDSARAEWSAVLAHDPGNVSAVAGMKRLRALP